MLQASWNENPLDTLKLIFQTRDCRGGKGEKLIFYNCLKWLATNHLETLKKNIEHVPFFGTWKDLLTLVDSPVEAEVLNLFVDQLKKDVEAMKNPPPKTESKEEQGENKPKSVGGVSLCAKWAPTEGHKHDVTNKSARKLARKLFPKSKKPMAEYRKEYLVPLRKYLQVTEIKMTANKWDQINYQRVPSRCMNLERKAFAKHDQARFLEFLSLVKSGKASIKGKQMFPHELCNFYMTHRGKVDEVVELQWKVIIDDILKGGVFKNSIVLSDVSGSMSGIPMQVSIALGLLISEVTAEPFKDVIITFHETPTFYKVTGQNLCERVSSIAAAPWGGTTNFLAVFDLILARAKQANLAAADMPKRMFVLSDMQFDQADGGNQYKTAHQVIKKKYAEAGYEVPTLVYWNLRANTNDFPVSSNEAGVALVSGFSPSLLKLLMDEGELNAQDAASVSKTEEKPKIDPKIVLRKALDDERYNILKL
eukprot:TRINITY_DN2535_c0_g1_i1.p1 TRINITY_DN2535_c0_g1~~TRINITY_DN2535_c0_g1_i1.p1  ORF type:complete len:535 (-),score=174.24 TRINITY_DN2535_c0_g1_i1:42-1478(-)